MERAQSVVGDRGWERFSKSQDMLNLAQTKLRVIGPLLRAILWRIQSRSLVSPFILPLDRGPLGFCSFDFESAVG